MKFIDCQREMRTAFLGGFAGQLVSGLILFAFIGRHLVLREQSRVALSPDK